MKKILIIVSMTICIVFGNKIQASACMANPNCMSSYKTITCIYRHGVFQNTHNWYGINNNPYICGITNEISDHTIICQGCGHDFGNETRICSELHSNCGADRLGLCQYQ